MTTTPPAPPERRRGRSGGQARPKRLRQHTNPLAFQGDTQRPDWDAVLGGPPQELEVGFGLGELLLARAALHPETRICGVDVRWAYVERVREQVARMPVPPRNLYFAHAEGRMALADWIEPGTIRHLVVYFPDPWFKRRHAKRRFVNPENAALLARALAPGGLLHVATDQEPLAREMMDTFTAEPLLENAAGPGRFAEASGLDAQSGREVEHISRGQRIWRLLFRRRAP
jgi:tRNA (guanine-N7-)-methyltransferase